MKIFVVLVVVAAVIAGAFYMKESRKPDASEEIAVETTAKVERGSIQLKIPCTGKVVSNLDVEIKCKASGQVVTLPFDISDTVKKGNLLLELDPVDEERRLRQAKVNLAASEAKLAQAKENLDIADQNLGIKKKTEQANLKSAQAKSLDSKAKAERMKKLLEQNLASQEEFETESTTSILAGVEHENAGLRVEGLKTEGKTLLVRKQDVILAETQVESNRIDLELSEQRLKDTKVYAPIDGVVSARTVQIGQIISSPISNVSGGTTLLTLSDLSRIFILASVDESDIGRVQEGQEVLITSDAFLEDKFRGKVVRIATKGLTVSNVTTFEVKIEVTSENKLKLKPEMTANVEIIAIDKDDVLLVPVDALRREKGKQLVHLPVKDATEGAEPEVREVQVGVNNGTEAEIKEGLSEGEEVLLRGGAVESRWTGQGDRPRERTSSSQGMRMMMSGGRRAH